MSNARRGDRRNSYRAGYLRSRQWFVRRDRWFRDELTASGTLACAACGLEATARQLELHHNDYIGVRLDGDRWIAGERHEDLTSLHPYCHEQLHKLMDRDVVLRRFRTRRVASAQALVRLRRKLLGKGTPG